jgi:3D (Asp-Asp-Asp) domain-containing protein
MEASGENPVQARAMTNSLLLTEDYMVSFKRKDIVCVLIAVTMFLAMPMASLAIDQDNEGNSGDLSDTGIMDADEVYAAEDDDALAEENPVIEEEIPDLAVKAVANGRSYIKVSWKKVKGAKGYNVYRSTSATKRGTKVFQTSKASVIKFTDKKTSINKKYYYTVKPIKKRGSATALSVGSGKSKAVKNKLKVKRSFKVKSYAYTGGGTTASGKKAKVGRIAVDPRVIKLGTWLYVEGYGLAQACDKGGGIKGKIIDVYLNSVKDCYNWGVHKVRIYILK